MKLFTFIMTLLGYEKCYECGKWFKKGTGVMEFCSDDCERWNFRKEMMGI